MNCPPAADPTKWTSRAGLVTGVADDQRPGFARLGWRSGFFNWFSLSNGYYLSIPQWFARSNLRNDEGRSSTATGLSQNWGRQRMRPKGQGEDEPAWRPSRMRYRIRVENNPPDERLARPHVNGRCQVRWIAHFFRIRLRQRFN
jgi:hypothetical protein